MILVAGKVAIVVIPFILMRKQEIEQRRRILHEIKVLSVGVISINQLYPHNDS